MISTPYTAIDMITCCAWPIGLLRSRFRGPGRRSVCCLFAKVRYHTYQQSECVLGKSPVKPDMQLPKAEDT